MRLCASTRTAACRLKPSKSAHRGWCAAPSRGIAPLRLGQVGLAHVLDQHASAREHHHEPGNDGLQQCVEILVGGRTRLDEAGRTVGVAAAHSVQHQTVQANAEVGGRAETLDQRDGAAVAIVGPEPGIVQQRPRNHVLHHLQHRRDQLGMRAQQHAQRDGQRQHPLPYWHMGDDMVHPVRCSLRHPARTA